jgi:ABC-type sugar transport system permease subunit
VSPARRSRPLLAWALGTTIAGALALGLFVVHRNREHTRTEIARAAQAAAALAAGKEPLAQVIVAAIVDAPRAAKKYPFLRRRRVVAPTARPLGGPDAPASDKLIADAATRTERDGAFASFLADGSGWVVATQRAPSGVAVVVAQPMSRPASFPWLVMAALAALGAGLAWVGRRLGDAPAFVGLSFGVGVFAVPALAWGGVAAAAAVLALAAGVAALDAKGKIAGAAQALRTHRLAYTYLVPAGLSMAILVLAPFAVGLALGFFDHSRGEWHYVGWKNFTTILSGSGRSFSDPLNFWFTLAVTVAWTAINVALHVTIGVALALALREKWMRARGLFRVLLILPWAIPNYITAMIWRGMFQQQYGAVNALLDGLGLDKVAWFSHFASAFTANVVTNTWLGFPFMMVVALGALETIPRDLYEAASVDGAGPWARFVHITLPNLRPALLPAVVLGSIWTFNMFNVIYLVSGGRPAGATDILVTQAYRWAFDRGQRYGMAAAYATIIFVILVIWTLIANRLASDAKGVRAT